MGIGKVRIIILVLLLNVTLTSCAHLSSNPTEVAQKILPATAYIVLRGSTGDVISIGSGFFIQAGTIVTCYHVVANAIKDPNVKISIFINGKLDKAYEVHKIAYNNEVNDIAVITTDNIAPSILKLGNSDDIRIGQSVYVAGNPNGIPAIFTLGIVSGVVGDSGSLGIIPPRHIIFSAPVAPGNSGGPLVDENYNVIGIVMGMIIDTQMANVAIPINLLDKNILQ